MEKANHVAAQRFWRTLPDDVTPEQAQQLLDTWCARRGDVRLRATADGKATVATLAAARAAAPGTAGAVPGHRVGRRAPSRRRRWCPSAATSTASRPSSPGPPSSCACRLGASHLDIATTAGTVIARHALAPAGAGVMVRDHGHVLALEQAAMAAASPAAPHRRKQRIPPGPAALAAADALRAAGPASSHRRTRCRATP